MLKQLQQDPELISFHVRGVPVRIQISVLCLPLGAASAGVIAGGDPWRGSLFMVVLVLLMYLSAAFHELGHILLARSYGATIGYVRISGLGAFVQVLRATGLTPRQDFLIAVAGPLASALLSAVLLIPVWPLWQAQGVYLLLHRDAQAMLVVMAGTNILLTVFNLLPIFPMDGGRAANAVLAHYMRPAQAVQMVSAFGAVMAAALAFTVAFITANLLLRLLAFCAADLVLLVSYRIGRRYRSVAG